MLRQDWCGSVTICVTSPAYACQMDPTIVITHEPSLEHASKMYQIFNNKEDNVIKVVMKPQLPA